MKHCFIIGSKGIPAHYGGLETFVEKLTQYRSSDQILYYVARMGDRDFQYEYNGARCFNLAVPEIGPAKAVFYDLKALQWCIHYCRSRPGVKNPAFYVLACRIGPFIGFFKNKSADWAGRSTSIPTAMSGCGRNGVFRCGCTGSCRSGLW